MQKALRALYEYLNTRYSKTNCISFYTSNVNIRKLENEVLFIPRIRIRNSLPIPWIISLRELIDLHTLLSQWLGYSEDQTVKQDCSEAERSERAKGGCLSLGREHPILFSLNPKPVSLSL